MLPLMTLGGSTCSREQSIIELYPPRSTVSGAPPAYFDFPPSDVQVWLVQGPVDVPRSGWGTWGTWGTMERGSTGQHHPRLDHQ